jgi:hypothetical protein
MFKKIAITISAVAFVMLAVALAPGVPAVLATVRTAANDELNRPLAHQYCQAFENWFLDPTCRQAHAERVARNEASSSAQRKPVEVQLNRDRCSRCFFATPRGVFLDVDDLAYRPSTAHFKLGDRTRASARECGPSALVILFITGAIIGVAWLRWG